MFAEKPAEKRRSYRFWTGSVSAITLATGGVLVALAGNADPAPAASVNSQAKVQASAPHAGPVTSCESLASPGRFENTVIESATAHTVSVRGKSVSFCEVKGEVSPVPGSHIGVVFRLPDQWNGRVLGLGGGGAAGNVRLDGPLGASDGLARGYAVLQTDSGHPGADPMDSSWNTLPDGSANIDAIEDFAYRAIHNAAVVGKAAVAAYYGKPAIEALFMGCSTGGRQALASAQRYPGDYSSIIAGAPAFSTRPLLSMIMAGRAFSAPQSRPSQAQVKLINDSILKSCDAQDGLKDGIVNRPRSCGWDPAVLACKPGESGDQCLSKPQVEAVRTVYQDHRAPDGSTIAFGLPKGAELSSYPFYLSSPEDVQRRWGLQHSLAAWERPADYDLTNNDPVADYLKAKNSLFFVLQYSENPDISPFIQSGGRLLMWTGMYDQLIPSQSTADYYESMKRVTAAQLAHAAPGIDLDNRAAMFTSVGVSHCFGGVGPYVFDPIGAMEQWIATDRAPTQLLAVSAPDQSVKRSRPMCPWPTAPRYKGEGDPNDAKNFTCAQPPRSGKQ